MPRIFLPDNEVSAKVLKRRLSQKAYIQRHYDQIVERRKQQNQRPERKAKELARVNKLYTSVKEYNRLKHLGGLFLME